MSPRAPRAYSLIELVMVLTLMGIVAAIAAPRYASSLENYRASAAARQVVADLHLARSTARVSSTQQTLAFNRNLDSYSIETITSPGSGGVYTVSLRNAPYHARFTRLEVGSKPPIVSFDGFGTPSSGGVIAVMSGRAVRTITVDPQTGGCTIQ